MTFATLKADIAAYLKRDDLTSQILTFVKLAEDLIAADKRLRLRAMETASDLTITDRDTALPTGFLGVRRLYLSGSPNTRLDFITPDDYWSRWGGSSTGKPAVYTIEGENILVGPVPDTTYTGKLLHWKRFTALSADIDTNWILENAYGLLLHGALLQASPYLLNDPRLVTWSSLFDDLADKLEQSNKMDRFGPGKMQRSEYTIA